MPYWFKKGWILNRFNIREIIAITRKLSRRKRAILFANAIDKTPLSKAPLNPVRA